MNLSLCRIVYEIVKLACGDCTVSINTYIDKDIDLFYRSKDKIYYLKSVIVVIICIMY